MWMILSCFLFFKQKTAYEMRISDWSSDVCSSDLFFQFRQKLFGRQLGQGRRHYGLRIYGVTIMCDNFSLCKTVDLLLASRVMVKRDRKSVVWGKSVSVGVGLGGCRIHNKTHTNKSSNVDTAILINPNRSTS